MSAIGRAARRAGLSEESAEIAERAWERVEGSFEGVPEAAWAALLGEDPDVPPPEAVDLLSVGSRLKASLYREAVAQGLLDAALARREGSAKLLKFLRTVGGVLLETAAKIIMIEMR